VADGSICSRREQRFYRHCPRYKGRCASASAGAAICKNFWCASGAYHCRESASASPTLRCARFGPAPSYAEKSAIQNRISFLYNEHVAPQSRTYQEGEVSHEKMRARRRLLQALHSKDPEAIKQAKADAIKAGYSNAAVGAIGRTPSDVFLFSKLPEADQQAILRQANKEEFERYTGHAHMKLRRPMRGERAGNQAEGRHLHRRLRQGQRRLPSCGKLTLCDADLLTFGRIVNG
jgi:hypothetical protein